jgi:hypothetical protein
MRNKRASDDDRPRAKQRRTASPADAMQAPAAKPTRFPIVREVRYKVMNSKGAVEIGTGETINISSKGVLFNAHVPLPSGKRIELSINWPAQLDGKCGLKLVARGRIVRCEGTNVALEIEKYEFRTAGRSLGARTGS